MSKRPHIPHRPGGTSETVIDVGGTMSLITPANEPKPVVEDDDVPQDDALHFVENNPTTPRITGQPSKSRQDHAPGAS
ncbi:hypothetical protein KOW79_012615 [Hemibagrus wyckioides]|uniref:Uncharacterized protein n=1 Tax=Hemibagrus wyckioides TaxID=337641 RepID=A0A9D3NMG4_9TELE|nr:hypothetical protein KOW79_012615 [Hemibagrus wyckioides]